MSRFVLVIAILLVKFYSTEAFEQMNEYQTIVVLGSYHKNYTIEVHSTKEVLMRFPDSNSQYPYVVYVWSRQAFFDHPVFIVTRQQKDVTSWELPLPVETKAGVLKFTTTSRTLCHNSMDIIAEIPRNESLSFMELHKKLSISISSASKIPTSIVLRVTEEENFYIEDNTDYTVTISPAEPRFFYYKFHEEGHADYASTIVLEVTSEDETCLTVSIQNATCPVGDLNQEIEGKYQTVNLKGGIIIKEKEFPNGFFIVFVAKGDNYDCSRENSIIPQPKDENKERELVRPINRSSTITFNIKPSISKDEYLIASLGTLGIILIFYLVFSATTWGFYSWANLRKTKKNSTEEMEMDCTANEERNDMRYGNNTDDVDARLQTTHLMLNDLAKKSPEYLENKSSAYLWHVISIAIFYGIPVVQLVVTYQRVVNISGNQDICYYNFLCAHPLFGFSDFNHIYSNVGYVLVGILFLLITYYRHNYVIHSSRCGIPKHYGLFYAMGVALIMEGILSACYHICPNQSNFQFDTSFMYVMAVLCIVQLYQKRHPDINATAYATFVVLGFAIFAAMVGVLNGHIALWILFIIVYVALCFYVSFNIYFLSYVKRGMQGVYNEWNEDHSLVKAIEPKRKAHFILLVVANVINVVLASLGILCYFLETDFATFLLGLLMGNAIMYAIVYITMKLVNHERICLQPALFGILGLATWMGATFFFINNSTLWTVTAAESKQWNTHCQLLNFYDFHDIWHLLSAPALFFSFMLVLTLDDDLVNTPQTQIVVF